MSTKLKGDQIQWTVRNCPCSQCPLQNVLAKQIDAMTGEKAMVEYATICPQCLGSVKWRLRAMVDSYGMPKAFYCDGFLK